MARLTGFEPVTIRLEGGCSIPLSYRRITMIILSSDTSPILNQCFTTLFKWSEQSDSNLRPPGPKPGALPGCAMLRFQLLKVGVNDGIRTRDNWNHNPGLYQLSYIHHNVSVLNTKLPNGAPDRIRTCDHPLRRRMLYPTELQAHDQ